MLQICKRKPIVGGDLGERNRLLAGPASELHHYAYAVLGLG
jgi:hypothetical protein